MHLPQGPQSGQVRTELGHLAGGRQVLLPAGAKRFRGITRDGVRTRPGALVRSGVAGLFGRAGYRVGVCGSSSSSSSSATRCHHG
ncbi:hypothetical protein, partial [Micromonospora aurantiaca]|uniref:hypothetical protein n=1 Tax=Micromonospora aurantiaca (nom. illeg.) TaxID=47850 RepID=UPI00197B714D